MARPDGRAGSPRYGASTTLCILVSSHDDLSTFGLAHLLDPRVPERLAATGARPDCSGRRSTQVAGAAQRRTPVTSAESALIPDASAGPSRHSCPVRDLVD